ncbi:hypothetical protein BU23DRAFT_484343, partial [Bimuria novae-zelandiae CBS 107.79]
TYDHRRLKTRLPVRSAIYKQSTGGSVLEWVTIGESPLLYVFAWPNFLPVWSHTALAAEHCASTKLGHLTSSLTNSKHWRTPLLQYTVVSGKSEVSGPRTAGMPDSIQNGRH